jgi:hypothetical protein
MPPRRRHSSLVVRQMQLSLRLLFVCLLFGTTVTIGIAWCPALWSSWSSSRSPLDPVEWPFPPAHQAPSRPTKAYIDEAALLEVRVFYGGSDGQFILRSGWPFRCLERGVAFTDSPQPRRTLPAIWSGLPLPASIRRSVSDGLPIRPIVPGMAANLLLYSAAAIAAVSAAQWYLRRARATRNLCPVCGYPQLATRTTCSECGSASGAP